MWKNTVITEVSKRTGIERDEVERLLTLFFGKDGMRKSLREHHTVRIYNFMSLFYSPRKIYLAKVKMEAQKRRTRIRRNRWRRQYERKMYKLKKQR